MRDDEIIAFIGPSLPRAQARAVLAADYRPPAARGDVYRATRENPRIILLIDGVFEDRPAVFHKEILWALAQGIHVFGSSSIGALRAAELDGFGMVGIGKIYEAYRAGWVDRDDAVALIHGPEELDYPVLSCALVDVWATFGVARRQNVIDEREFELLNKAAAEIFYKERTYDTIIEHAARHRGVKIPGLADWIALNKVSQKEADTLALLEHVAAASGETLNKPFSPNFRFEWTVMWDRLKSEVDWQRHGIPAGEFALVLDELRATCDYELIVYEALACLLAEREAWDRGCRFDDALVKRAAPGFRRKNKLFRGDDVAQWISERHLNHADYVSMVLEDFYLDDASGRYASRLPNAILSTLRRRGRLSEYRDKIRVRIRNTIGHSDSAMAAKSATNARGAE